MLIEIKSISMLRAGNSRGFVYPEETVYNGRSARKALGIVIFGAKSIPWQMNFFFEENFYFYGAPILK